MATFNTYAAMFAKLKDIFQKDKRTSNWAYYGAEYSKKKTLPCVLIFPAQKEYLADPHTRDYRKAGLPKQVKYHFNLWCYTNVMEVEDNYYSTDTSDKAGITQVITEVEAVLKANKTANDLITPSQVLWTDLVFKTVDISNKPGKVMHAIIEAAFITKELE